MNHELLFSAPGRVEISGNHTDHQWGQVLAAAVNLHTQAWVYPNGGECDTLSLGGIRPGRGQAGRPVP